MLEFTTKKEALRAQDSLIIEEKSKGNKISQDPTEVASDREEEEPLDKSKNKVSGKVLTKKNNGIGPLKLVLTLIVVFLLGILTGMKLQQELDSPQS